MTNIKIKPNLVVSFALIVVAGYFFVYALFAIYNFGLHSLFADQWRIYTDYFNKPFPLNILAIQNGHHPVIAGLFFLLDIKFFRGHQTFLLSIGTLLAVITALGIIWPIIKSHRITFFYKSAVIYIVVSGMFWLGNYRILLHANESVHAYLVTAFLFAAISALTKCKGCKKQQVASQWCMLACVLSQFAAFSFGSGVAVPPTLLVLAFLMRLSRCQLFMLAANITATAIIYLALPSASAVAGVLASSGHHLQKLINIFYLAGAPLAFLFSPHFSYVQTAIWVKDYLCPIAGGLCLLGLIFKVIWIMRSKSQSAAIYNIWGLAIFSWITIALIAIMRVNFFMLYPQQVFANRYLLWSNFLWISIGLILLMDISSCPTKMLRKLGVGSLVIIFIVVGFLIQHNNNNKVPFLETWSNSIRLAATSLIVGVHDDKLIFRRLRESPKEVYALSKKLKRKNINIFASPLAQNIGKNIHSIYELNNNSYQGNFDIEYVFNDGPNHTSSARFSGWINCGNQHNIEGILITVGTGKITGYAFIPSHLYNHNKSGFLFYRGYIKDYNPKEKYRLYGIIGLTTLSVHAEFKNEVSPVYHTIYNNGVVLSSL